MKLQDQITADIKQAMLSKDTNALGVLRMLKSTLTNLAIEKKTQELDDTIVLSAVRKNIKTRQDSVDCFTKGGRPELVEKEQSEIAILEKYLPVQLAESELVTIIDDAIKEVGATSKKDMGKVMKVVSAKVNGAADGKTISALVGKKLM